MKYHSYFSFLKKQQNFKLSSVANYRLRFKLFAYWVILHVLPPADFFQHQIFQNSFRNTIRVPNSLDPDQARRRVWSGFKLFAKLSADGTG